MKKLLFLSSVAILAMSMLACSKINDRIDSLENRIDNIDNTYIAPVKSQIEAIGNSIAELTSASNALKSQIAEFQKSGETYASEIESLNSQDESIGKRIDELKSFVENELKTYSNSEWVKATFATLEEYGKTCETVAGLKIAIEGMGDKIDSAIVTALSNMESSIKDWINEQLKGYYTIAQIDAKIAAMDTSISIIEENSEESVDSLNTELNTLKTSIDTAKTNIRDEYRTAISTAITKHNGEITQSLKDSINAVNVRIDDLDIKVNDLQSRMQTIEYKVSILENLIQSIVFIPEYQDGMAIADALDGEFEDLTLDFKISPASAINTLVMFKNFITIEYKSVEIWTKSIFEPTLPIKYITLKPGVPDVISVTIGARTLDALDGILLSEDKSIALCMHFKAAGNDIRSDYASIKVNNVITPTIGDFAEEFVGLLDVWENSNVSYRYVPEDWTIKVGEETYDKSDMLDIALHALDSLAKGGTLNDKIPEVHNYEWANMAYYEAGDDFQNAAVDLDFIRNAGYRQLAYANKAENNDKWANYVSYTDATTSGEPSVAGLGYNGKCCLERQLLIMARFFRYLLDNEIESNILTNCESMMLSASLYSEPVTIEDFAKSFVEILDVWGNTYTDGTKVGGTYPVTITGRIVPEDIQIQVQDKFYDKSGMFELAAKSLTLLLSKTGSLLIPIPEASNYSWAGSPYYESVAFANENVSITFLQNFVNRQISYAKSNNAFANGCGYYGTPSSGTPSVTGYSGDCCIERELLMLARLYKYVLDNNITKHFDTVLKDVTFSSYLYYAN